MAITNRLRLTTDIGGVSISSAIAREGSGLVGQTVELPAAVAGTLTTRTDDDTGVITKTSHGVSDSSVVDVYWTIGGVSGARYGMATSGATSDTFAIDGGTGDNLPADESALTYQVQQVIDVQVNGDNVELLAVHLNDRGHVGFRDDMDAEQVTLALASGEAFTWASGNNVTNPLDSLVVESIVASHADSAATKTLKIGMLQDNAS